MTWHGTDDGYRIFFNRDERRERKPATEPAILDVGGTRFIAPIDGDFGGTWIAVSEHGVSVCLLNGFSESTAERHDSTDAYISRGMLPLAAIEHRSTPAMIDDLGRRDLHRFRPFLLVVFETGGGGLAAHWSGVSLEIAPARPARQPIVSSSFYTEQVRASRFAVFDRLVEGDRSSDRRSAHRAFHESHLPQQGPHSPCMHRPDASTVSFSEIAVDRERVRFHYAAHSPCRGLPQTAAVTLARSEAGAPQLRD